MGKTNDISCIINDALSSFAFVIILLLTANAPMDPTYIHIYDRWMRVKPTTNDYC